jgi:hypothetical protein
MPRGRGRLERAGRAAWVEPLHARHRLGQPILIATAAVALSMQEFLRISPGLARALVAAVVQPADRTGARRRFRSSP